MINIDADVENADWVKGLAAIKSQRTDLRDEAEAHRKAWDTRGRKGDSEKVNFSGTAVAQAKLAKIIPDDPHGAMGRIFGTLPGDVLVTVFDQPGNTVLVTGSGDGVSVHRAFTREGDELTVEHVLFNVDAGHQGKGIAKTWMAGAMAEYQRLGVTEIHTDANLESGAYAWARFGFKADNPAKLAEDVYANAVDLENAGEIEPVHLQAVRRITQRYENDPRLPWHLAGLRDGDLNVGQAILEGMTWQGRLRLDDQEAMGRLMHYLKDAPPPKDEDDE